jgi:hypothetical protein
VEKIGQLFSRLRVLLDVTQNDSRACSSHGFGFQYPQQKNSPPKCKAPRVSGAFTPFGGEIICWASLGETYFSVECEGSCAVEEQHDSQGSEGEDVVVDSEALMDANGDEGGEHVDRDQNCGETGEQTDDEEGASEQFREGGDVSKPVGEAESYDVVRVVVECAGWHDLLVAVHCHGGAKDKAHEQRADRLQTIKPFRHREVPSAEYRGGLCKRMDLSGWVSREVRAAEWAL